MKKFACLAGIAAVAIGCILAYTLRDKTEHIHHVFEAARDTDFDDDDFF